MYRAVAGCASNDLFRKARHREKDLGSLVSRAGRSLVSRVDAIAEIPNSPRQGSTVRLEG